MEEVHAKVQRVKAELLAAAKADAAARGKEPFDLAKLEALCDTSSEGRSPERQARFERMYYVNSPGVMTLAAFAEDVKQLSCW